MQNYTVTIGSLTEDVVLVTISGINCPDRDTAGMLALAIMAMPNMWAVSSIRVNT